MEHPVDHLLRVDPHKLSDDAAAAFARQLAEQIRAHLDEEEAPGGLLDAARERGPAYTRLAARLQREHRSLRREIAHLERLGPTSRALRPEITGVIERMAEHERAERALTTLPRRRSRRSRARRAEADTSTPMTRLQAAEAVRQGPGEVNEDTLIVDKDLGLIAIIDGMGGPGRGDVAAATALEALRAGLPDLADDLAEGRDPGRRQLADHLERLVGEVHQAVATFSETSAAGPAAVTLVLGIVRKDRLYLAHVGDTRAYLRRRDRTRLLTEDHTEAMRAVEEGTLDPDAYETDAGRTALSRALGWPGATPRSDLAEVELADGDVLLFCSDGVPRGLSSDELDTSLSEGATPSETADALLRRADDRDLPDDLSAVVVHVGAPRGPDQADRVAAALSDAFLFRDLSEAHRVTVARYLEPRMLDPDEVLVEIDGPGDGMFIVAEGRLVVRKGKTRLTELTPGEHLGELSLTRVTTRSATVQATEPTLVYGLTREDFRKLCVRKPRLGLRLSLALLDFLGDRVRDLTDRVDRDRKARDLRRRVSRSSS